MNNEKQVQALNKLLATCYNTEKGFEEAARDVESGHLKEFFREYSRQRYDFGHEIKDLIRSLGGEVDKGDTFGSKVHRAWMDLKSALATNEEKAILEEVKKSEETAVENFNEALDNLEPGSEAFNKVVEQRNRIRTVIERVEQLIPVYEETK